MQLRFRPVMSSLAAHSTLKTSRPKMSKLCDNTLVEITELYCSQQLFDIIKRHLQSLKVELEFELSSLLV